MTDPFEGPHLPGSPMQSILRERERQILMKGYDQDHDDAHSDGDILAAAVSYLWAPTDVGPTPSTWPWEPEAWNPRDKLRNLVKAGALCCAERDRILRSGERQLEHVSRILGIVLEEFRSIPHTPTLHDKAYGNA